MKQWTVKIFNGFSTSEFQRYGTYEYVRNSLIMLPPSHIWSIQ